MSLANYSIGDRVEVDIGGTWLPGTVIKALNSLGYLTVDLDATTGHAFVTDTSQIRSTAAIMAPQSAKVGRRVSVIGNAGSSWRGEIVARNGKQYTILLDDLDNQTVVVGKKSLIPIT